MARTLLLVLLLAGALASAGLVGGNGSPELAEFAIGALDPALDLGGVTVTSAAICAPSSDPAASCEDVFLVNTEGGTCTTNLGRSCREAHIDAVFRRWLSEGRVGGDIGVIETGDAQFIDDRTLVVGRDSSGTRIVEVNVADTDTITVTFLVRDPVADLAEQNEDGSVNARVPVLTFEPVVVELPTPRAGRSVVLRTQLLPPTSLAPPLD